MFCIFKVAHRGWIWPDC